MRLVAAPLTLAIASMAGLLACADPPPPPRPPPQRAPVSAVADQPGAERAAKLAILALQKRSYNVRGCVDEAVKIIAESETASVSVVDERCAVRVARRADGQWIVVVRSPSQLGNVWAVVTVSRGGEGVTHVDYKAEGAP